MDSVFLHFPVDLKEIFRAKPVFEEKVNFLAIKLITLNYLIKHDIDKFFFYNFEEIVWILLGITF
jgi:hypothetical protein